MGGTGGTGGTGGGIGGIGMGGTGGGTGGGIGGTGGIWTQLNHFFARLNRQTRPVVVRVRPLKDRQNTASVFKGFACPLVRQQLADTRSEFGEGILTGLVRSPTPAGGERGFDCR
jgi:hypothetical protein